MSSIPTKYDRIKIILKKIIKIFLFGLTLFLIIWLILGYIVYLKDCKSFEPAELNKLMIVSLFFGTLNIVFIPIIISIISEAT
jgi:hypothetical protein